MTNQVKVLAIQFSTVEGSTFRLDFDTPQVIEEDIAPIWAVKMAKDYVAQNRPGVDVDVNTVRTIEEGDVNMNDTVNGNEVTMEKEEHFEAFKKLIDETAEMMANTKQADILKKLALAEDEEIYDALIDALDKLTFRKAVTRTVCNKLIEKQDAIEEAVQDMVEDAPQSKKAEVWAKIKSVVKAAVRKIVAFLEGTAWFAIDTIAVVGTAATRILVTAGKETFYAGRAIGHAFKKDIIDSVREA